MTIDTSKYISAYGRKPAGYRCWIFRDDATWKHHWLLGDYEKCKKKARKLARKLTLMP